MKLPSFPKLSRAEFAAVRSGCRATANRMVMACEPRITALAAANAQAGCATDDLVQAGRIAVWQAAKTYDPALGGFENYATRAVANAFRDERRRGAPRLIAGQLDERITAGAPDAWAHIFSPPPLNRLSDLEFDVLFLLYACGLSQRAAAALLDVSQPFVSRTHRHAIERLRRTTKA